MSVHEDSRQGNCSWSVVINTPLACPPDQTTPANDTSCNKTTAAGTYVLPSFAKKSNKVSLAVAENVGTQEGTHVHLLYDIVYCKCNVYNDMTKSIRFYDSFSLLLFLLLSLSLSPPPPPPPSLPVFLSLLSRPVVH